MSNKKKPPEGFAPPQGSPQGGKPPMDGKPPKGFPGGGKPPKGFDPSAMPPGGEELKTKYNRTASRMRPGMRPGGGPRRGGGGPPGMGFPGEKAKDFKGSLKRVVSYLKPFMFPLLTVAFMCILSTLAGIAPARLNGFIIDIIDTGFKTGNLDSTGLLRNLMLLGLVYVFSALFGLIQQWTAVGVTQKMVFNLRRDVDDKLSRLPLKYYDSKTHGELMSRVVNDVDVIANTLQQSIVQVISSTITIVGVLIIMLTISWQLTLITLAITPIYLVVVYVIAPRSQKHFVGQQRALGEINGHVEEMFTGHKIVKAFGHEAKSVAEFDEINEQYYRFSLRAQFISGMMMPLMRFIGNLGYVLVCVVGGVFAANGRISVGDVQSFIQYVRQFNQPINQTSNIANIIQNTVASAERIFEMLDETEEPLEGDGSHDITNPVGEVSFEHIEFGYSEDKILMKDLDIKVKPGQTIAIVGPTGAGKTTLVNLLLRFYDVSKGSIKVDGVDVRDMTRSGLRKLFGMVLQDAWLFNGTICENIRYGRQDATEQEVQEAAVAARADHFIRTLPDGYDTMIGEEASDISQGQRQLLTIARAFLADPAILILDEATSSVDTRTEVLIQHAMNELMKDRTSFVIAHRLSTIRDADLILVMNNGDIIEQGSHMQLLEDKGFYYELYQSQFSGRIEDEEAV